MPLPDWLDLSQMSGINPHLCQGSAHNGLRVPSRRRSEG